MKFNIWKLEVRVVPTREYMGLALLWWPVENLLTIELLFWEIMFSLKE